MEVLCSPVNGKATMLENVHDEMFSEKNAGRRYRSDTG